jgi:hypothetical protein
MQRVGPAAEYRTGQQHVGDSKQSLVGERQRVEDGRIHKQLEHPDAERSDDDSECRTAEEGNSTGLVVMAA